MFDAPLPAAQVKVPVTPAECRAVLQTYFRAHGSDDFKTLRGVENMSFDAFQAMPAHGNIFGIMAGELMEHGVQVGPVRSDQPVLIGDVLPKIGVKNTSQANALCCHCVNGDVMKGSRLDGNLGNIKDDPTT